MTAPLDTSTATLLAIDDQEDNLALLDGLLSSKGYRVLTALNGPEGLALAQSEHPALILLDLAMPGMDGFQVLERLRQERATAKTPVIVLTANYREASMVERGLELGATEYLTKPIQLDELVVRIRSALRLAAVERELEKLRRDFASMLVHDMRSPLDGVRLALSILRRQEQPDTPRSELLDNALGALRQVNQLMDDLLQANRLEELEVAADLKAIDLPALVESSLQVLRPIADERGLSLFFTAPEELPAVQGDAGLLRRVIDNLVGNALKFTEQGEVRLSAEVESDMVRLHINDTGPGIPAESLGRVFDRYYHIERRQATRQGSFGLGLAFCERAMTVMGGQIGVSSEEGAGSDFWITLPISDLPAN